MDTKKYQVILVVLVLLTTLTTGLAVLFFIQGQKNSGDEKNVFAGKTYKSEASLKEAACDETSPRCPVDSNDSTQSDTDDGSATYQHDPYYEWETYNSNTTPDISFRYPSTMKIETIEETNNIEIRAFHKYVKQAASDLNESLYTYSNANIWISVDPSEQQLSFLNVGSQSTGDKIFIDGKEYTFKLSVYGDGGPGGGGSVANEYVIIDHKNKKYLISMVYSYSFESDISSGEIHTYSAPTDYDMMLMKQIIESIDFK